MASNSFGNLFRITTWGESHGKAMGVVIDGCPAGLPLDISHINTALAQRAPGKSPYTSPRKEPDIAELYSGVFEGKTTGAPISIVVMNTDANSAHYEPIKHMMRPGHANYTYLEKYGCFDYRGGGRASGRETLCRVAAAAVATQLLAQQGIDVLSYLQQVGHVQMQPIDKINDLSQLTQHIEQSPIFCPDPRVADAMMRAIQTTQAEGDSLGGVVAFHILGLPTGLGDPVYEKLEANLAKAMLSIPASKGFMIGEGFRAASMTGSAHNDTFQPPEEGMHSPIATNHAGGTLAGISTGQPVVGEVAFKPTASIKLSQQTIDNKGKKQTIKMSPNTRHDPCLAIRAVPVVKAMCALVIADALLQYRSSRV